MTLCPVAIMAGCRKCPAFGVCPLKGVIGDYREKEPPPQASSGEAGKRESGDSK